MCSYLLGSTARPGLNLQVGCDVAERTPQSSRFVNLERSQTLARAAADTLPPTEDANANTSVCPAAQPSFLPPCLAVLNVAHVLRGVYRAPLARGPTRVRRCMRA